LLVEDTGVEAGIHALAWATGGEGATTAHEGVEDTHRDELLIVPVRTLEGEGHVGEAVSGLSRDGVLPTDVSGLGGGHGRARGETSEGFVDGGDELFMVHTGTGHHNVAGGEGGGEVGLDGAWGEGGEALLGGHEASAEASVAVGGEVSSLRGGEECEILRFIINIS